MRVAWFRLLPGKHDHGARSGFLCESCGGRSVGSWGTIRAAGVGEIVGAILAVTLLNVSGNASSGPTWVLVLVGLALILVCGMLAARIALVLEPVDDPDAPEGRGRPFGQRGSTPT